MPLYEYECESCAHRFERIQKFSDPLADTCPECSGPVHKLLSSPAFQFKGTGWYVTDYARKDQPGGGGADKESTKTDGAGEGAKAKSGDSSGTSSGDGSSDSSGSSESSSSESTKTSGSTESSKKNSA